MYVFLFTLFSIMVHWMLNMVSHGEILLMFLFHWLLRYHWIPKCDFYTFFKDLLLECRTSLNTEKMDAVT